MAKIQMKGVKIKNLDQLREYFDFTNARDYLLQGTLSAWMREQGETELAKELEELKELNYSDQTLMDNFSGIFGIEQKNLIPETTEIIVAENPGVLPVKTNEISVGNLSFAPASCFGETGIIYLDEEKLSRYGLEKSDGKIDDIRRFAKNRLALYIVFKIANTVMHPDFVKQNQYQLRLELDTDLCDVGWGEKHFILLGHKLDTQFNLPSFLNPRKTCLVCDVFAGKKEMKYIKTIRNLLDFIARKDVRFRFDVDYDGKFTHMLCNGRYEDLEKEYEI